MPESSDDMVTIDSLTGGQAQSWGASLLLLEPGEEAQVVVRKVSGEEVVFTIRREGDA